MKYLMTTLAVMFSVVLTSSGGLLGPDRFDGLFGHKFGERVEASVATIPSSDGTLLASIDPKAPEFVLSEYWLALLPKSRSVCGFVAALTFTAEERVKCNAAYDRLLGVVGGRLGKMQKIDPVTDGSNAAEEALRSDIVKVAGERMAMLQLVKHPGDYVIRFIAIDMAMTKKVVDEQMELAKNIAPLTGLFGKNLGVRLPPSEDEAQLANGAVVQAFVPNRQFLDFDTYIIQCLPRSRKVFAVTALQDFEDRFEATQCYEKVAGLLEKKFKLKLVDCTSNFSKDKPDEDGEQMLKASAMAFPGTQRYVEVHCLRDHDDGVFRVRIIAEDIALVNLLESETRTVNANKDTEALEAL